MCGIMWSLRFYTTMLDSVLCNREPKCLVECTLHAANLKF